MVTELRLAARRLANDPWTTLTAIVTVALGAGVTIAVFAIGYGLMLRPLPYDAAKRLWLVDVRARIDEVENWRNQLTSFERLTTYSAEGMILRGLGDTRQVRGAYVDDRFFEALTSRPIAGRTLTRGDVGAAVISERLARATGIGAQMLLGQQIVAGGATLTVVGIVPEAFAFPSAAVEIWIPSRNARPILFDRSPDARRFRFAGWLRPGVSAAVATDEVERVRRSLHPDASVREERTPLVEQAYAAVTRGVRSTVLVFAGAAGMLWIVTCANLAAILMGRTIARRRELAVCDALGAGVWRRTVSLLSESVLITLAGGVLGVLLAWAATAGTLAWTRELIPRPGEIRLDTAPLAFAAVSSAVLAMIATVLALPALRRRAWSLNGRHGGATAHDRRLRGSLLVLQVALVVVLVSSGALLLRTLTGLMRTDLGLEGRNTLVSELVLTPVTTYDAAERWTVLQELLERVRTLPGVRFAGAGSSLPPDHAQIEISVRFTSAQGEESHAFSAAVVTPGYLEAIGARLIQGRYFERSDIARAPSVILSESAAKAVMEGPNIAGRELPFSLPVVSDRRRPTVIGVVKDIRYSGLEAQPDAAVYALWNLAPMGQGFLAIQTSGAETSQTVAAIRTQMRELDPALPHMPMRTFDEVVARSVGVRRVAALLGALLALLAFGVALIGLAGNVLRSVEERRRELAIRAALGATPAGVVRLVASHIVSLSAAGLALGIVGALATARTLRALVEGVRPYDSPTLIAVGVFVILASLLASYLPARRAGRIDPAEALKAE